jgi:Na+-driven multidrug efflux pump
MLLVSSYYLVGQTVNTVVITGVFRAGGDTKFGMWCDTINMWCVSVPIGFVSAFVLHLPPKWVYFILCLDEFYKVPVEVIHYRKYKWLRNVTREAPFGPAEAEPE